MNWYNEEQLSYMLKESKINWKNFFQGLVPTFIIGTSGLTGALGYLNVTPQEFKETLETSSSPEEIRQKIETIANPRPSSQFDIQENLRNQEKVENYDPVVARIIFSEASNIVSPKERELVAAVIRNRIDHPGFEMGKLDSMSDVVTQRNAFEALGDPDNINWKMTENPENIPAQARDAWEHSKYLASGNARPIKGPSGRPLVYYHDKSISKPRSWDNKYWKAVKEVETPHFIFYSVKPSR